MTHITLRLLVTLKPTRRIIKKLSVEDPDRMAIAAPQGPPHPLF